MRGLESQIASSSIEILGADPIFVSYVSHGVSVVESDKFCGVDAIGRPKSPVGLSSRRASVLLTACVSISLKTQKEKQTCFKYVICMYASAQAHPIDSLGILLPT